jgi:AcrR family transcriptional regulator
MSSKDSSRAKRNPRQSRERILAAALREFAGKGFAGARVDAIARSARINKRMLYHYFGNKEELFREVIRRKMGERVTWMASAPEDLADNLPFWFQVACRDPEWVRLLEWEALQWADEKVIDEEHRRAAFRQAIERLKRLQASGRIAPEFDLGQLLLSIIAVTAYSMAFPQVARLATGLSISDEEFRAKREEFLRQFAAALRPRSANPG